MTQDGWRVICKEYAFTFSSVTADLDAFCLTTDACDSKGCLGNWTIITIVHLFSFELFICLVAFYTQNDYSKHKPTSNDLRSCVQHHLHCLTDKLFIWQSDVWQMKSNKATKQILSQNCSIFFYFFFFTFFARVTSSYHSPKITFEWLV